MSKPPIISHDIAVSLSDKSLVLTETLGTVKTVLLNASIVSGCYATGTPSGVYKGGKWIKDKANPSHGPVPWSRISGLIHTGHILYL